MNFKRLLLIVSVMVLGLFGFFLSTRKAARARYEVKQLQTRRPLEQLGAVSNIVKQGDVGYGELARGLRAEETTFDKQYDKWRSMLPPTLRDQLPMRPSRDELRRSIARIAGLLGPV